jgi:hypothetical protein
VFAFHVPNGGFRSKAEARVMAGLGVRPAVPSIILVKGGTIFALELKAAGGRLSPAQQQAIVELRAAGATADVANGPDDALAWLESVACCDSSGSAVPGVSIVTRVVAFLSMRGYAAIAALP